MRRRIFPFLLATFFVALTLIYFFAPGLVVQAAMVVERGGLHEKSIQIGDHTIRYLRGGKANAPIAVFVHGLGADKDNWTRMVRTFTDDLDIIALDLPGFGESTRLPDASYDIASQVDRLDAFIRALAIEKHHLAGNSMGGWISGAYAARFPERVLSVAFLANAGVTPPTESEVRKRMRAGENPLAPKTREGYEQLMDLLFVERPVAPGPVLDWFANRAIENADHTAKVWRDIQAHPLPLEAELAKLAKVPVLVLWGDTDKILDPSSVEVMRAGLPHAKVIVMPRTGHVPMIERPKEVARHYREFLGLPN
jgi:abhydrolase domain-containing protein 6